MKDDALEYARGVLRDLHRDALLRGSEHTSAQLADEFVVIARGLDDLQTDDVRDAVYRAWATREGHESKGRALALLRDENVALLVHHAHGNSRRTKPLRLFEFDDTMGNAEYFAERVRSFGKPAALWAAAAEKHSQHPDLPLGKVLDATDLTALADASLEAEAV